MKSLVCLSGVLFAVLSCKDAPVSSQSKDFAFDANAKNFAVIAGFRPDDPEGTKVDYLNWLNMLQKTHLGNFEVVYASDSARAQGIAGGFSKIGSQITENSTVLFAYSGSLIEDGSAGLQLQADQAFALRQAVVGMLKDAKANGVDQVARAYFFIDATNSRGKKVFASVPEFDGKDRFFREIVEFTADSQPVGTTANFSGRLSYEFVRLLSSQVESFRQNPTTNPTLAQFFNSVSQATNVDSGSKATYFVYPPAVLEEKFFNDQYRPPLDPNAATGTTSTAATPTASIPATSVDPFAQPNAITNPAIPAAQPVASVPAVIPGAQTTDINAVSNSASSFSASQFGIALNGPSGQTTLAQQGKGTHMLIEFSASWCGPCKDLALDLANKEARANCGVVTIMGDDSQLSDWSNAVGANQTVMAHSFSYSGNVSTIAQSFGGSMAGYPTLLLVDTQGKLVASGREQARQMFPTYCP